EAMPRGKIEIAVRCMIIDRKTGHADRHYAILPSPAFFLCEFVVANPLNSFYDRQASELHLQFAGPALDDRPQESKFLSPLTGSRSGGCGSGWCRSGLLMPTF